MGRALYSSRSTKAARQPQAETRQQQAATDDAQAQGPGTDASLAVPEPAVAVYEKWSPMNPFDPDSDDFFLDAEYEAFVDEEHAQPPSAVRVEILPQRNASPISSGSSSAASEDGDREDGAHSSPMAIGVDPATLLAGVYAPGDWERRFLLAGAGGAPPQPWLQIDQHARPGALRRQPLRTRSSSLSFLPSSAPSPRPVALPPVFVPSIAPDVYPRPSAPPPRDLTPLFTPPPPGVVRPPVPTTSPSESAPSASATPRLYTWGYAREAPASPAPPPVVRRAPVESAAPAPVSASPPSNPLTNPNARMSHSRISPRALAAM
ncbi:hypothetical protein BD626DRAFT_574065 [Schizophyllum amplum]|uniref:Uncharacterized protein n=1 Tax=Schizophyllum amplum TaxID=97359 RepID=A0A550BZE1_9AGAR|nr:hypothetical protein BD626DRAFT_574065 [Auriculariopsis ampla]